MASTVPGRDVVPNVPDLFGGIGVRTIGANVAQGTTRVNPVNVRPGVAKKRSGTLRRDCLKTHFGTIESTWPLHQNAADRKMDR